MLRDVGLRRREDVLNVGYTLGAFEQFSDELETCGMSECL